MNLAENRPLLPKFPPTHVAENSEVFRRLCKAYLLVSRKQAKSFFQESLDLPREEFPPEARGPVIRENRLSAVRMGPSSFSARVTGDSSYSRISSLDWRKTFIGSKLGPLKNYLFLALGRRMATSQ